MSDFLLVAMINVSLAAQRKKCKWPKDIIFISYSEAAVEDACYTKGQEGQEDQLLKRPQWVVKFVVTHRGRVQTEPDREFVKAQSSYQLSDDNEVNALKAKFELDKEDGEHAEGDPSTAAGSSGAAPETPSKKRKRRNSRH